MTAPQFNMRQLLEAGVHFGHQSHRWNPKMAPFIYGARNNIHILDLTQTVPMLHQALNKVSDTVAAGGRVLFVATKRQASDSIAEAAKKSAQYFINHRWLGGTLTNWKTISTSIRRLRQLDDILADPQGRTKKEVLNVQRERDKLNQALGGIKDMGGVPDLLFVIDTNKEGIAIKEARKLGIPIVAIVDTNCDPDGIDFPVPGNDDAGRAITLYCDLIARAALDGLERGQGSAGVDVGASAAPPARSTARGRYVQGHRRPARRSRRSQADHGHHREARAEAQRRWRVPLLADRRPRRGQPRRSRPQAAPQRSDHPGKLGRTGQEAGRSFGRVVRRRAIWPASLRFQGAGRIFRPAAAKARSDATPPVALLEFE